MTQTHDARFVTEPVIACIAEMIFASDGVVSMTDWVRSRAPACLPDEMQDRPQAVESLFPHDMTDGNGRRLTDNELLPELAGRKCYNSFGLKAGRKSNREYIEHTQQGDVPHASIMYHAKMSFFIAGISRRVSHELIRNYVGADRTEEGSPSQESTRYVRHPGFYVVAPADMTGWERENFEKLAHANYAGYCLTLDAKIRRYEEEHGESPKGMDYKRILESCSQLLLHSVETSFVWTTNPMALAKLFKERCDSAADLEFQRFANAWKKLCMARWANLFPQPWMQETK